MSREKVVLSNVSKPYVEAALCMGYEVYMGINRYYAEELDCDYDVKFYTSHTYRSLFDIRSNYLAIRNLMELLRKERIDVIHCNTPIGGLVGRICGLAARVPKVIYTVHGFHFYKGASLINNTVYKWAEQLMARCTDVITTMNREDYEAAQRLPLRNGGRVYYVPGVGIDTEDFQRQDIDRAAVRRSLGLREDDVVLIAMGDLIKRKNYAASIQAIARARNPKLQFLICGKGPELDKLRTLAERLAVEQQIHFLGFRQDIKVLLAISDMFLFTTYQEGLPRSMMEAMAAGLPCIASRIRGNVDLIEDGTGGLLRHPDDIDGFAEAINTLAGNEGLRRRMGIDNLRMIQKYDVEVVRREITKIFEKELS